MPMHEPPGIARREFLIGASAAAGLLAEGRLSAAPEPPSTATALNVRQFGVTGDGVHDDTLALTAALNASRTLFVPAGTYLIDRLLLPAGTTLLTEGPATTFQQRPGLPEETRILNIIGSNVRIGDCTVKGNIGSDTGEQRHGIFVEASERTGDLTNIRIGNISGGDLRGDVVYVGASNGRTLAGVEIGNVHGSNILRNVVSVVGGRNIAIGHITGARVGYMHLDIEPDESNGPVTSCTIASVHGGFVQVAGQTAHAWVDRVQIEQLQLQAPMDRSNPIYAPGLRRSDALTIRNLRSLYIGRLIVSGFPGAAIRQVWDPGALDDQYVHIREANFSDCCAELGRAFIQGDRHATRLIIGELRIGHSRAGVDVVLNCKSAKIEKVDGRLPISGRLIAQFPSLKESIFYAAAGVAASGAIFHFSRRFWR